MKDSKQLAIDIMVADICATYLEETHYFLLDTKHLFISAQKLQKTVFKTTEEYWKYQNNSFIVNIGSVFLLHSNITPLFASCFQMFKNCVDVNIVDF